MLDFLDNLFGSIVKQEKKSIILTETNTVKKIDLAVGYLLSVEIIQILQFSLFIHL